MSTDSHSVLSGSVWLIIRVDSCSGQRPSQVKLTLLTSTILYTIFVPFYNNHLTFLLLFTLHQLLFGYVTVFIKRKKLDILKPRVRIGLHGNLQIMVDYSGTSHCEVQGANETYTFQIAVIILCGFMPIVISHVIPLLLLVV